MIEIGVGVWTLNRAHEEYLKQTIEFLMVVLGEPFVEPHQSWLALS